ncbi:hypothetical protein [Muricoccus vinaceus]|uniref:Lipocalin n=1 Tax=Muricoccus vinaceus TaxID=424704 RepID=A0ABV6IUM5_9PROT
MMRRPLLAALGAPALATSPARADEASDRARVVGNWKLVGVV